ncbi:MAG: hypothetical protein RH948_09215 [Cyclobacteriaceae bacterium]
MKRIYYILITLLVSSSAYSQSFVPKDFVVPPVLENEYFRIRMLTVNDVVKDYDAVMTSIDHLKEVWPGSGWPSTDLTFEQDLIDLGWHQKEFQRRSSFAYTVLSLDESEVLGCLYIDPTTKAGYDAEVYMWVRTSVLEKGYDKILFDTVKNWISKEWPFKKVAYPGREISWKEWKAMK